MNSQEWKQKMLGSLKSEYERKKQLVEELSSGMGFVVEESTTENKVKTVRRQKRWNSPMEKGEITSALLKAAEFFSGKFTTPEIMDRLKIENPPIYRRLIKHHSASPAISRLVKIGKMDKETNVDGTCNWSLKLNGSV